MCTLYNYIYITDLSNVLRKKTPILNKQIFKQVFKHYGKKGLKLNKFLFFTYEKKMLYGTKIVDFFQNFPIKCKVLIKLTKKEKKFFKIKRKYLVK